MAFRPLKIVPQTSPGRWSLGLIVLMPVLIMLGGLFSNSLYRSVPAGGTLLADLAARPVLALSMLAGMAAGIAAFITGLLAFIRQKEHALLVYASTLIGALLLAFLAAEFLAPH